MIRVCSLIAVAALTIVGCGDGSPSTRSVTDGSSNGGTGSSLSPRFCSMTLSGAVSGTFSCDLVMGVWGSEKDRGAITLSYNILGASGLKAMASVGFVGEPATKTYSNSDADANGGLNVVDGQSVWATVTGKSNSLGSYTMTVTSVTPAETQPNGKSYRVAGTLKATLTPAAGTAASGTVTMVAEFH